MGCHAGRDRATKLRYCEFPLELLYPVPSNTCISSTVHRPAVLRMSLEIIVQP
jgi:hypothetical protein